MSTSFPYSAYEFLSIALPGAVVIGVAQFGGFGWSYPAPSATVSIAIVAASYATGHLVAALSSLATPLLRRGRDLPLSLAGVVGRRGKLNPAEEKASREAAAHLFNGAQLEEAFGLGYTLLRHRSKADQLTMLNQQIGFHRNMATAYTLALLELTGFAVSGRRFMYSGFWIPTLAVLAIASWLRFRQFWWRFGVEVCRGIVVLSLEDAKGGDGGPAPFPGSPLN